MFGKFWVSFTDEESPREVFQVPVGSPATSPSRQGTRSPSQSPLKSRSDSTINSEEDVDGTLAILEAFCIWLTIDFNELILISNNEHSVCN